MKKLILITFILLISTYSVIAAMEGGEGDKKTNSAMEGGDVDK